MSSLPARPRRSAAERRAQAQRAHFRVVQRLLRGFHSVQDHRGCQPTALGAALGQALSVPYGSPPPVSRPLNVDAPAFVPQCDVQLQLSQLSASIDRLAGTMSGLFDSQRQLVIQVRSMSAMLCTRGATATDHCFENRAPPVSTPSRTESVVDVHHTCHIDTLPSQSSQAESTDEVRRATATDHCCENTAPPVSTPSRTESVVYVHHTGLIGTIPSQSSRAESTGEVSSPIRSIASVSRHHFVAASHLAAFANFFSVTFNKPSAFIIDWSPILAAVTGLGGSSSPGFCHDAQFIELAHDGVLQILFASTDIHDSIGVSLSDLGQGLTIMLQGHFGIPAPLDPSVLHDILEHLLGSQRVVNTIDGCHFKLTQHGRKWFSDNFESGHL